MLRTLVAITLLTASALAGEPPTDPAAYERLLIPVYIHPDHGERGGAFGSRWKTDLLIRNEGPEPIAVFTSQCVFFCTCVGITCAPGEPLAAGAAVTFLNLHNPVSTPAGFLYVERTLGDRLSLNLRVFDASRSNTNFGTEIPVVREREFRTGTTWLTNIPIGDLFRVHLRIYGISSPSGEGAVRVRIYPLQGSTVLFDQSIGFLPADTRNPGPVPRPEDTSATQPAYAEIGSINRELLGTPAPERIRIEITSLTANLEYWAFVSITNNETQHVTTITPQ